MMVRLRHGFIFSILIAGLGLALFRPGDTAAQNFGQSGATSKDGLIHGQRFASLRASKVNLRVGPGVRYPITTVYVQKSLPVEIIAELDTWRKTRDWEGTEGWIHRAMLSSRRSVIVIDEVITLHRHPTIRSRIVAKLSSRMVALVEKCDKLWCYVVVRGFKGWVQRNGIWGLGKDETIP